MSVDERRVKFGRFWVRRSKSSARQRRFGGLRISTNIGSARETSADLFSPTFSLCVLRHLSSLKKGTADGGGFEPPLPFGKHAFQACAIDHSATHPFLCGCVQCGRE